MDFASKFQNQHGTVLKEQQAASPRELRRIEEKRIEDEKNQLYVRKKRASIPAVVFSWTFQIVLVIMLAYVLVLFFGQKRITVGQSMDPLLSGGDEVLINTIAYQLQGPAREDIVSFKPGGNESSRSSIKRVIGLPGETVQIVDGQIYIDEELLRESSDFPLITNPGIASSPVTLGEGEYFVLGDNRNNSEDSRFAEVGTVEESSIEGKVWFVLNPEEHRRRLK